LVSKIFNLPFFIFKIMLIHQKLILLFFDEKIKVGRVVERRYTLFFNNDPKLEIEGTNIPFPF
jgi:hypothetical protein